MLVLFQREPCSYCRPVRELLTELQVSYLVVNVPKPRDDRHELIRATGSKFIPALLDGATVIPGRLEDNTALLAYLRQRFAHPGTVSPSQPSPSQPADPEVV